MKMIEVYWLNVMKFATKFKKAIAIKIHSMPNIKTKVKEFDDVVNANL